MGQTNSSSSFPSIGKLPLTADVMKYFMYRRNLPDFKLGSPSSVFCPLKTGTQDAKCWEPGGCCSDSQSGRAKCVVAKVKVDGSWHESGFAIIKDQNITRKILKLFDKHRSLVKNKSKESSAEEMRRSAFKEEM